MLFDDIETERLLLKNISFDDRLFILKQFSDEVVNRYLFDAEPISKLEEADEIIDFYLKPDLQVQHRWVIVLKNNDVKIGTCGFHCWNKKEKCVDIGYDLQEEYWGKGIMAEALKAIISSCINKTGVHRINAHISVDNAKSIYLAQKLGFVFNGKTKMYSFRGKEYLHNIYTLDCISKMSIN